MLIRNGTQTCSWLDKLAMFDVLRVYFRLQHPPGCCMFRSLCNYSYIKLSPTVNDTQHRETKGQAHKLEI